MTDSVNYCHPAVTRVYSTKDLVDQLFTNLRTLAPEGAESAYIVDFTNQQAEAFEYNKRAYARRQAWVDQEFGVTA